MLPIVDLDPKRMKSISLFELETSRDEILEPVVATVCRKYDLRGLLSMPRRLKMLQV